MTLFTSVLLICVLIIRTFVLNCKRYFLIFPLQHPVQDIRKRIHCIFYLLDSICLSPCLQKQGSWTQMQIIT